MSYDKKNNFFIFFLIYAFAFSQIKDGTKTVAYQKGIDSNSSLYISFAALIVSGISLVYTIYNSNEQRKIDRRNREEDLKVDRAKRAGEALTSAQNLKNVLADNIEELKASHQKFLQVNSKNVKPSGLAFEAYNSFYNTTLKTLEKEYQGLWGFIEAFELLVVEMERGKDVDMSATVFEAKIGRFNQRRILAEYDCKSLQKNLHMKMHEVIDKNQFI